jgi:predicted nucleic acid-binding Zn ribbon protein
MYVDKKCNVCDNVQVDRPLKEREMCECGGELKRMFTPVPVFFNGGDFTTRSKN